MSKITKLFFQPKKTFKDSLWFKKEKIKLDKSTNLYIVANYAQLHKVEKVIEYEKLTDNLLIILYTKRNLKMPKLIQTSMDKQKFKNSFLLLLPNSPNNYNLKSLVYMKRNYEQLIDVVSPKNLYLLSFENHYSIIGNYAKKKGINLTLLDEGTGTYKEKVNPNIDLKHKIFGSIFGVDNSFDWFVDFDKVYAAFPELLVKTFNAKEYVRFFEHAGNFEIDAQTHSLIKKYNISSDDFLYVNQRYAIQNKDFVWAILTILDEISKYYNAKVFIKMHPKDHDSLKNEFKKKLIDLSNIVFIEENEFLIEPTIQFVKPKGVIGLTSTSLVYAPLVSPYTNVYSIAPWFLSMIPSVKNQNGIEIIQNHFKILEQFKHVNVLENIDDLSKQRKEVDMVENFAKFADIANQAYTEKKYLKSIINYMWAYPKGIESMPIDDFEKYCISLEKTKNYKELQRVVSRRVDYEIKDEKKDISNYQDLIYILVNVVSRLIEYPQYSSFVSVINNNILALLTYIDGKDSCNIDKTKEYKILFEKYKYTIIDFIYVEAKQRFLYKQYDKSLELFNELKGKYFSAEYYIYYIENMLIENNFEEAKQFFEGIKDELAKNIVKLIESIFLIYQNKYREALKTLKVTEELNSETLYLELYIAKVYRLLEEQKEAKAYLIKYEKHSKGNLLCHREIAYLEYSLENYKKCIAQLNKVYPKGIESMPIDDTLKYIKSKFEEKNYLYILDLKEKKVFYNIKFYYLSSLYKMRLYAVFIDNMNSLSLLNLSSKDSEKLLFFKIISLREIGLVQESYLLIKGIDYTEIKDFSILYVISEIFELMEDFYNSKLIWKIIISKHKDELKDSYWNRYYNILQLLNKR
jgi:hypothetical protein